MSCEYCEEGKNAYLMRGYVEVYIDKWNDLVVESYGNYMETCINFCPMCGRDLRGDDQ